MLKHILKDSFYLGIFIGLIHLAISYYTYVNYEKITEGFTVAGVRLNPPRLQLIILAIAIILFRFMIINWNMSKTGKGLLFTMFTGTLIFLFYHKQKIF